MKAIVSGVSYELTKSDHRWLASGQPLPEIIVRLPNGNWLLRDGARLMELDVENISENQKQFSMRSGHKRFQVLLQNHSDVLLEKMGFRTTGVSTSASVRSPMPGLISKVLVEPGSNVLAGDPLFVLDAMKMENLVKAPVDATIKQVLIKIGDRVEKGQELILF